ncbi:hypothetical protein CLOM_g21064 [Closterium sp. NIES-68]|nr:hypothetical protein CLOM_g21064 [Closterium sp. NIES-68]GJP62569.1 hypothetical protein CLOP_g19618 [Closterium sp. NIES-67]
MAPELPPPKSEYEAARKQRIQENQKRMAELGILEASRDLSSSQESKAMAPRSEARKVPRQRELLLPQRKSARMAAKGTKPRYIEVEFKAPARSRGVRRVSREAEYRPRVAVSPEAEERALRAAGLLAEALARGWLSPAQHEKERGREGEGREGKGKGQPSAMVKAMVRSHVHGCFWLVRSGTRDPTSKRAVGGARFSQPRQVASPEAQERALRAADGLMEALHCPCMCKHIQPSQMSGGFWLGLNKGFCTAHLPRSIATLTLKVDHPQGTTDTKDTTDRKRPRRQKHETQEEGLQRDLQELLGERRAVMGGVYAVGEGEWRAQYLPHKSGLSGGWRGFALDQELDAGDAVVFEKVSSDTLKVHIFRAADYEEDAGESDSEPEEVLPATTKRKTKA